MTRRRHTSTARRPTTAASSPLEVGVQPASAGDTAGEHAPGHHWSSGNGAAPDERAENVVGEDLVGEATAMTSLVRDPGHLPGTRRKRYSPLELYALNHEVREDIDPFDDALWLWEEPLTRIDKNGIELGGVFYCHERLQYLVTGPKGTPVPDLYIRYNRAALSRGILDEVRVYRKDEKGLYVEQCRCRPRSEWLATADTTMVLREREHYVRRLTATVKLSHDELLAIRSGTAAVEALRDQERVRAQRHKAFKPAPMVATPRFGGPGSEDLEEQARARTARLADGVRLDRSASNGGPVKQGEAEQDQTETNKPGEGGLAGGSGALTGSGRARKRGGKKPSLSAGQAPRIAKVGSSKSAGDDADVAPTPPQRLTTAGASDGETDSGNNGTGQPLVTALGGRTGFAKRSRPNPNS